MAQCTAPIRGHRTAAAAAAACPVCGGRRSYFTPFAGVNMPKYAYIMPANENEKGV